MPERAGWRFSIGSRREQRRDGWATRWPLWNDCLAPADLGRSMADSPKSCAPLASNKGAQRQTHAGDNAVPLSLFAAWHDRWLVHHCRALPALVGANRGPASRPKSAMNTKNGRPLAGPSILPAAEMSSWTPAPASTPPAGISSEGIYPRGCVGSRRIDWVLLDDDRSWFHHHRPTHDDRLSHHGRWTRDYHRWRRLAIFVPWPG
jgi:hypothetical protein